MPAEGQRSGVFVSYARSDGGAFARRLVVDLEAQGISAWLDRREMYGGRAWRRQIVDAIGDAAYLVLVLTPSALSSEIVAWEWQVARRQGVCVFPVRADPGLDVALAPAWMRELHWYTLDEERDTFIANLRGPCDLVRVPFMAGDLPGSYVPRKNELLAAKRLLLRDRGGPGGSNVVLYGPGGYGKTTMALALCHDEEVGATFYDGVLWVSLGQQPDLVTELDRMHIALTGRTSAAIDVQQAADALHTHLVQRRCLLIIDDVWRPLDLRPFMRQKTKSALVVTSRQFDVTLEVAETGRIRIDEMAVSEALDLVTFDLAVEPSDSEPYRQLVQRLGSWPLLVNLIHSALRARVARGAPTPAALSSVVESLDRRQLTAFDAKNPHDRNQAAAASVALSLELLATADAAGWAELAIFPEDTPIPIDTLAQLWGMDRFEAEELAIRLADTSLLQLDLGDATVEVHDVLLEVAQRRVSDRRALHRRLLDAWGELRALPENDRYAWRWVVYHLVAAGQEDLLRDLLLDPAWLERRLAAVTVEALLADFDLVPDEQPYQSLREAMRMSQRALAADPRQLSGQLRGRLLSTRIPALAPILDRAAWMAGPRLVPLRASLRVPPDTAPDPMPHHESPVVALAVADNGRAVVSGSGDGVLKVWDVRSGALLRTISDDRLDPDRPAAPWTPTTLPTWGGERGPLLAGFIQSRHVVASARGRLTVWDLDRGTRHRVLGDPPKRSADTNRPGSADTSRPATALGVTPDGRYVVSASWWLQIWDQKTGAVRSVATNHVTALALADSRRAVTGSSGLDIGNRHDVESVLSGNALRVWDLVTGTQIRTLEGHRCGVNALATSPDGRFVVSAPNPGLYLFEDTASRMWNLDTGEHVRAFDGHRFTVASVAVSPDGRHVVSGGSCWFARYGNEFTVMVWDGPTGEHRQTFDAHTGPVTAILVTPDSRWAVSAGGASPQAMSRPPRYTDSYIVDGSIRVWDLETQTPAATFQGDDAALCMVMPDPHTVVVGSLDGAVHILRFDRAPNRVPAATTVA